jgi:O-antigen/teichoic acid export membrane protein
MTILAAFLVNAGLSFALSLVVAHLIGPAGFGRYALALSIAVAINTILFEWLRLSATRFYSERSRATDPGIRHALGRGYLALALLLAAAVALALALGFSFGLSGALLAATAAAGLTLALFDYAAALARARFLDRVYAGLALVRGVGAFLLAAGAAWLTGDAALVLTASSAATLLAVALVRAPLADARAPAPGGALGRFARYALPLVAASALYQLLPVVNRLVLADRAGFAEAGYFSLAGEVGMRLFQNLGSALDLVLFQMAIRADETLGRAAAERQITRNAGLIAALLWPASVGLWLVLPAFEAVFVPAAFRGHFAPTMAWLIPGLAGFALIQYALNPVFQLRARTAPVVAAAAVALVVDLAIVLLWPDLAGAQGFAIAQLAAFAAATLALAGLALTSGARLPWRDLAGGAGAAGAMVVALWPLREMTPSLTALAIQVIVGAAAYGAAALALDLAGCRAFILAKLRAARLHRPA